MALVTPSARVLWSVSRSLIATSLIAPVVACSDPQLPPTTTFYDRKIGPILKETCANSPTQSGCHVAADTHGNAFGNLNVTSYESLDQAARSARLVRAVPDARAPREGRAADSSCV